MKKMKKLVIIILTTLLTFGCFAQEFVPFELPYYEPITPTVEAKQFDQEAKDNAEFLKSFIERLYISVDDLRNSKGLAAWKQYIEAELDEFGLEVQMNEYIDIILSINEDQYTKRLEDLEERDFLIAYACALVYLEKFCY